VLGGGGGGAFCNSKKTLKFLNSVLLRSKIAFSEIDKKTEIEIEAIFSFDMYDFHFINMIDRRYTVYVYYSVCVIFHTIHIKN
jgi:hypothetical protein